MKLIQGNVLIHMIKKSNFKNEIRKKKKNRKMWTLTQNKKN